RHFGHGGSVRTIAPSPDDQYLLTSDGVVIRVWSQSPTRLLMSFHNRDDEWIAWTPEGYYAASANGERLMGWQVSNGPTKMASFYPAAQFRKSLYRPDVVKRVLEAGSVEKALTLADKERGQATTPAQVAHVLPPRVTITSPAKAGTTFTGSRFEV